MPGSYLISYNDWSLHRKGEIDRERHREKVREAIKNNLAEVVSEEAIILKGDSKTIKVPVRSLEEYSFRFDPGKEKHVGQGNGATSEGDLIGSDQKAASGHDQGAGDEPGTDYYEAEITVEELAQLVFEDLRLPNLKQKQKVRLTSLGYAFNEIRKQGISSNIDRPRTILEAIKRNALTGQKNLHQITGDDLRFKTWQESTQQESSAVVLAMMDTSGSMGPYEKYIARSFYFWMVEFLRTKYQHVDIVFLAHDVTAKETGEQDFFTKGADGGTKCSSVYQLALEIIRQRFSPQDYNIYAFHFSDGDNLFYDNEKCVRYINELLAVCNLVGYGEIENSYYYTGTLRSALQKINHPQLICLGIKDKYQVYQALKTFFNPNV